MSKSGKVRFQVELTEDEHAILERIVNATGSTKKNFFLRALNMVVDHATRCQQGYKRFYEKQDGSGDRIQVEHEYDHLKLP